MIGRVTVDRLLAASREEQPRQILRNSSSLLASLALTSGVGFVYWFVAALAFPQSEIGIASASISAMMLLASLATLGLGTLMIAEIPRHRGREPGLIATAMIVAGTVGAAFGIAFSFTAAQVSPEFRPIAESVTVVGIFSVGVGLTAGSTVLDVALLGLLRGDLQLARTGIFALAKLGLLAVATVVLVGTRPLMIISGTWVAGLLLSIMAIGAYASYKGRLGRIVPLEFEALRLLRGDAVRNHALNLSLSVPDWTMPILVTALLSPVTSGAFFIAWLMAGVAMFVPAALAQALFAVCARAPETLPKNLRLSLRLSFVAGVAIWLATLVFGPFLLSLLGHGYSQAAPALVILALGVFPVTIKVHYVTVGRLENNLIATTWMTAAGAIVELVLATVGGLLAGLTGLAVGVLLGLTIQAVAMTPRLRRVLRRGPSTDRLQAVVTRNDAAPYDI